MEDDKSHSDLDDIIYEDTIDMEAEEGEESDDECCDNK